jgi:ribA/ribD-fused uncharacterized protein
MTTSVRDVADLNAMLGRGERVKFLFFWGHQPEPDGRIGAGCLSQWWPAPFTVDDRVFATAEHYMMWRKATLFGDRAAARKILEAPHPHAAKALGGRVTGFDQQVWDEHRVSTVVTGNLAKFRQHLLLGDFLAGTSRRILVEASPVDRIWGIGLTRDDPAAADPGKWHGLNLLGFALMQVREIIIDQHRCTR